MPSTTKTLNQISKENKVSIIRESNLFFLKNYLTNHKELKTILEIGTGCGYSSYCLSQIDSIEKIDTIEKDSKRHQIAKFYLNENKKINLINADVYEFQTINKYDVIFLDGPKKSIMKLFEKFNKNLNPKGIFVIDNFYLIDLRQKYLQNNQLRLKSIIDSNDSLQEEIKKLNKNFYNLIIDESGDGLIIIETR